MDDMISRSALMTAIKRQHCTDCDNYGGVRCRACHADDMMALVDDTPSVDAEPVRHAMWEWYEDWGPSTWLEPPDCLAAEWRCSACKTNLADYMEAHCPGEHMFMDNSENKPTLAYCPHCGAKMDLS